MTDQACASAASTSGTVVQVQNFCADPSQTAIDSSGSLLPATIENSPAASTTLYDLPAIVGSGSHSDTSCFDMSGGYIVTAQDVATDSSVTALL